MKDEMCKWTDTTSPSHVQFMQFARLIHNM